jgi:DNA-binding CsgD family transcriptional regulator
MGRDEALADLVARTTLPAVVVAVPAKRIVAASPAALDLLAPVAEPVVGRAFEEYMADPPSGAFELLRAGRVNGFETSRLLRRPGGGAVPLPVWVRALGDETPPREVLTVLWAGGGRPETLLPPEAGERDLPAVVGTADADLVVDRISSDVEQLLGRGPDDVMGRSVLRLVYPDDAPALLWGLAEATIQQRSITLDVRIQPAGAVRRCQLLMLPLLPPPSFAFVLLPEEPGAADPAGLVRRLGRGIESLAVSRSLAGFPRTGVPGLSRLTSREIDIVGRLLSGDRVPAIAAALFLSQSTVRNHLSSVFGKLRVGSQQELVHLLQQPDPPSMEP